ncbi:MAG: efflux RND transporter periplasmic adaptor subunit [Acidobacteria bacterium]|nr:efflux RND transporter periplasmic adaptor subunit [Acidobacteriota bacterium]
MFLSVILLILLQQGIPPRPVDVTPVVVRQFNSSLNLVGTVWPAVESTVASKIGGAVKAVHVKEGDLVKQGDPLVELDQEILVALQRQAMANHAKAEADLHRAEGLREKRVISEEQYQHLRSELELRKAELAVAETNLKFTTISAPFAGYVTARYCEVGEWLDTGSKVVDLVDLDTVLVQAPVAEQDLAKVRLGQAARVTADSLPGQSFVGRVKHVIPHGDPQSHTFPIKVELENPRHQLKSGMSVRLEIRTSSRTAAAVPTDSLVNDAGSSYVFVIRDGVARKVKVETGETSEGFVAVRGAVARGDLVVVAGNEDLRDGVPVRATSTPGRGRKN